MTQKDKRVRVCQKDQSTILIPEPALTHQALRLLHLKQLPTALLLELALWQYVVAVHQKIGGEICQRHYPISPRLAVPALSAHVAHVCLIQDWNLTNAKAHQQYYESCDAD